MGHMTLKVIDENGYIKDYRQTDNVIVLAGWDALVENAFSGTYVTGLGHLNGTGAGPFSHIGIGSFDDIDLPAANTNTALGAELTGCPRSTLGIDSVGAIDFTGASEILVELFAGFNEPSDIDCQNIAISEAGLFNGTAAQNTVMFARNTFTTVPALGAEDTLEIEWDFTFNSGPAFIGP